MIVAEWVAAVTSDDGNGRLPLQDGHCQGVAKGGGERPSHGPEFESSIGVENRLLMGDCPTGHPLSYWDVQAIDCRCSNTMASDHHQFVRFDGGLEQGEAGRWYNSAEMAE